jgi:hypothetical protein
MKTLLVVVLVACTTWACGADSDGKGDVQGGDAIIGTKDGIPGDVDPLGDGRGKEAVDPDGKTPDLPSETGNQCDGSGRVCSGPKEVSECQGGFWVTVAVCPHTHICSQGTCVELVACTPGHVDGCYSLTALKKCNLDGTAYIPEPCSGNLKCINGQCLDTVCLPGQAMCLNSETKQECLPDGSGWDQGTPCPAGLSCVGGKCLSECLTDPKWANSYIGCVYWSVDLDNYKDPFSPIKPDAAIHGLILGNPGTQPATVTFTHKIQQPMAEWGPIIVNLPEVIVPAGGTARVPLPRMDINGSGIFDRSIRINSNRPIVAYQFNPLDFQGAYSDDSSLLIPAEMLGREYFIVTRPTSPLEAMPIMAAASQHGYFTIVATTEGTTNIHVTLTADTEPLTAGAPIIPKGTTLQIELQQFQVASFEASGKKMFPIQDLTGSHVVADQPVAVFGGHEETVIEDQNLPPEEGDCCCAEHIEEQFFPVSTWSTHYDCVKARSRGEPDRDLWIVMAAQGGTALQTDPPINGLHGKTLNAPGAFIEAFTDKSFVITSNNPIQVAQILSSQGCTAEFIGDPAMIMAVARDRYRNDYVFAVPDDYSRDYITVIRPVGEAITLDGGLLADNLFKPLADGAYEYAWVEVADGPHRIFADKPFGLSQYGWHGPASYGHPGGLDLVVH